MNKKYILPTALITLLSLAVFVSAGFSNSGDLTNSVKINRGWNLVPGFQPTKDILPSSEIQLSNIEAMWYYSPLQSKYIQIHPEIDIPSIKSDGDDVVLSSSMWLYSDKGGILEYSVPDNMPLIENRQVFAGWNFLSLVSELNGKSFENIKGSCDIQRICLYNWMPSGSPDEGWECDSPVAIFSSDKFSNINGRGVLVKVSSDCTLGSFSGNTQQPPQIPN